MMQRCAQTNSLSVRKPENFSILFSDDLSAVAISMQFSANPNTINRSDVGHYVFSKEFKLSMTIIQNSFAVYPLR